MSSGLRQRRPGWPNGALSIARNDGHGLHRRRHPRPRACHLVWLAAASASSAEGPRSHGATASTTNHIHPRPAGRIVSPRRTIARRPPRSRVRIRRRPAGYSVISKTCVQIAEYSYDDNGNRLSFADPRARRGATYDDQDRLRSYGDASLQLHPQRRPREQDHARPAPPPMSYDVLGNLTQVDAARRDHHRLPHRRPEPANRQEGQRRPRDRAGSYQDELEPVAELDGAGNVVSPLRLRHEGQRARVHGQGRRDLSHRERPPRQRAPGRRRRDRRRSSQRIDYDEFGHVAPGHQPRLPALRLRRRPLRPHTGLVRFGARDYDAEIGRWTAKDPIRFGGGDANLYGYVLKDPINFADPAGLYAQVALLPVGPTWLGNNISSNGIASSGHIVAANDAVVPVQKGTRKHKEHRAIEGVGMPRELRDGPRLPVYAVHMQIDLFASHVDDD